MLDHDFCGHLEYVICCALEDSDEESTRGFWCDGVLLPLHKQYYSQKFVNDMRHVSMKAFVGKNGQTEYELILKFGNKALSRYARNLNIIECVPSPDIPDWFSINIEKRVIEIQLD